MKAKNLRARSSVIVCGGGGSTLRGNKALPIIRQSLSLQRFNLALPFGLPASPPFAGHGATAPRPRAAIGCEGSAAEDGVALYPARTSWRRQGHGGGGGHHHREFHATCTRQNNGTCRHTLQPGKEHSSGGQNQLYFLPDHIGRFVPYSRGKTSTPRAAGPHRPGRPAIAACTWFRIAKPAATTTTTTTTNHQNNQQGTFSLNKSTTETDNRTEPH